MSGSPALPTIQTSIPVPDFPQARSTMHSKRPEALRPTSRPSPKFSFPSRAQPAFSQAARSTALRPGTTYFPPRSSSLPRKPPQRPLPPLPAAKTGMPCQQNLEAHPPPRKDKLAEYWFAGPSGGRPAPHIVRGSAERGRVAHGKPPPPPKDAMYITRQLQAQPGHGRWDKPGKKPASNYPTNEDLGGSKGCCVLM